MRSYLSANHAPRVIDPTEPLMKHHRTTHLADRLDKLVVHLTGRSRQQARALITHGAVLIEGRTCIPSDAGKPVPPGIHIAIDDGFDTIRPDATLPLTVLAQGDDWVAVDKPAGTPVHPLDADESGTLLHALAARFPQVLDVTPEGPLRAGVVHRLDVPTSGVVLFALSLDRYESLRNHFRDHRVDKRYLAVVDGVPTRDGELRQHLAVTRHHPAHVEVVSRDHADARRCTMRYRTLEPRRGTALLEVELITGFLHQARVMLAHIHHPILHDPQYGPTQTPPDTENRLMLHAHHIRIEDIDATSPAPAGFLTTPNA